MRVEIEDDGLPAQLAPRNRPSGPDDPNEPWSPNYGNGSPTAKSTADAASMPKERRVLKLDPSPIAPPPPPQRQAQASAQVLAARFSAAEENDIIRRAIAEHEMRRND